MMKFIKKRNRFENSLRTNTLDVNELLAYSYAWWAYIVPHPELPGTALVNEYPYNRTTGKHIKEAVLMLTALNVPMVFCRSDINLAYNYTWWAYIVPHPELPGDCTCIRC